MISRPPRLAAFVLIVASLGFAPTSARGAQIVIDPSNLAQNVLQAGRALEQIHNQIQAIEQQARMLASNPLQLSPELRDSIGQARQLFSSASGLAFEVDRLSNDLHTLYPRTWEHFELGALGQRTREWLLEDRSAVERSMAAEARAAQSIGQMQGRIDRAMQSSTSAAGQTGVGQATNQLLGINAAQLSEIEALLIAQSRALDTERMDAIARQDRALEVQRRAFPTETRGDLDPARSAF